MTNVVKKMEEKQYIKPYFDPGMIEGGCPGNLRWENGKLVYKNKFEILLYHLIIFKKQYISKTPIKNISESFSISPTRVYHKSNLKL